MQKWQYLTIVVGFGADEHAGVVFSVNGSEKVYKKGYGVTERYYIHELLEEIGKEG